MQRKITHKLQNWGKKSNRKPLVIKGARQVGKTWAIKDFGNKFFAKTAYFNFDENSDIIQITGWLIDGHNHDSGTRCCGFSGFR